MTKSKNEIPNEVKVDPIFSTKYLIDGEIKEWQGSTVEVYSSIQSQNQDN